MVRIRTDLGTDPGTPDFPTPALMVTPYTWKPRFNLSPVVRPPL